MFFKPANSFEKQLLNFRIASVSQFQKLVLTIIWNNLGLSNYKRMKRNVEFRKKARTLRNIFFIIFHQNIPSRTKE